MGNASWEARVTGLGPREVPAGVSHLFSNVGSFPTNRSSSTVGVLLALKEVLELREEELSARARGAAGGGLALDILGGLNGRPASLMPISLATGSLGRDNGLGGGTMVAVPRGVVGLFGAGTDEWGIEELELVLVGPNGSKDSRSLLANLSLKDVCGILGRVSSSPDFGFTAGNVCCRVIPTVSMCEMHIYNNIQY